MLLLFKTILICFAVYGILRFLMIKLKRGVRRESITRFLEGTDFTDTGRAICFEYESDNLLSNNYIITLVNKLMQIQNCTINYIDNKITIYYY